MTFKLGLEDENVPAEKILADRVQRVGRLTSSDKELADSYVGSDDLLTAVDVALSLGRPLLLTGDPGSGKTTAALWLAKRLGLWKEKWDDPDQHYRKFQVRSDSRSRDVCYEFDTVSWFREGQKSDAGDKGKYVIWKALGIAFGAEGEDGKPHLVLIDEIDKAPRDFPNDLLEELDRMQFTVLETGQVVGPPEQRPIIIITSNAERRLPEPFLRRCVTHHIKITEEHAVDILTNRLTAYQTKGGQVVPDITLIKAGAKFWSGIQKNEELSRKPTIAEFWQWLVLASEYPDAGQPASLLVDTLSAGTGSAIARLPRIGTLFPPNDLKLITGQ